MFSEKLAQIDSQCINDMQMGNQNSPFCINEEFRTVNGGGDFDPFDNSEGKIFDPLSQREIQAWGKFKPTFKMVASNKVCMNIMPKMHAVESIQIVFHSTLSVENVADILLKTEIPFLPLIH